jgi:hypothetical protein
MWKTTCIALLAAAWLAYVGTTAYVAWQIYIGQPPFFLRNYTLGTNAAWAMIGFFLWIATEWLRGFRNT